MKKHIWIYTLTAGMVLSLSGSVANAQKGIGDSSGVAKQAIKPASISMTGKVLSVDTHPCGKTTGKAPLGTHLKVLTSDDVEVNLHVGPADEVKELVKNISSGQDIRFDAFRTEDLPPANYVAKTLYVNDEEITLRDDTTLRPFWATRYDKNNRRSEGQGSGRQQGRAVNQQRPCWR